MWGQRCLTFFSKENQSHTHTHTCWLFHPPSEWKNGVKRKETIHHQPVVGLQNVRPSFAYFSQNPKWKQRPGSSGGNSYTSLSHVRKTNFHSKFKALRNFTSFSYLFFFLKENSIYLHMYGRKTVASGWTGRDVKPYNFFFHLFAKFKLDYYSVFSLLAARSCRAPAFFKSFSPLTCITKDQIVLEKKKSRWSCLEHGASQK